MGLYEQIRDIAKTKGYSINKLEQELGFAPLIETRGFYQYFQRNNIIYIDENLPRHEQLLVCTHELGHMMLHKKANALRTQSPGR